MRKIFIVGLPKSGRTTVSKALCNYFNFNHIEYDSWIKSTFRSQKPNEHIQQYNEQYHEYLVNRFKVNPQLCINNINDIINATPNSTHIIDGVSSPKDFAQLFDINNDMVVFLNRIDNDVECQDCESIGVSVIRDYCFWLSSAGFLSKNNWTEYNFKIPGEDSDFIKALGSKNSVYIVKSLNKAISHLKQILIQDPLS